MLLCFFVYDNSLYLIFEKVLRPPINYLTLRKIGHFWYGC